MRSSKFAVSGIVFFLATFLLAACSGSGDSGTASAGKITLSSLVLPDNVSVVEPQSIAIAKPREKTLSSLLFGAILADLPAASDYRSDKTTIYVNERSLDSFRSVNEILCMVRQSRYDVMINQGPYRAQVDKNLCSTNRSNASSAGQASIDQSSGATMPLYENWIIDSIRASSQSPHIVNVWVHPTPGPNDPPMVIDARIVITEGSDTAPPYGIFKMNFKALNPGRTVVLFKGFLDAERDTVLNKALLKFATEDKDSYVIEKATLEKVPGGSSGSGSVLKVESYPGVTPKATRFDLAYNTANFLRSNISPTGICFDRVNFNHSAWRYGLYTTPSATASVPAGTRVTRNTNFTVKKANSNVYGSIGYWGAWFPGGATVADNDQVYKHDYSTNSDTPYTVFQRGGKLKKYTKDIITLADIKNIPLIWFTSGTAYMVTWDGAAFSIVAQAQSDGSWKTITPQPFDLSVLSWVDLQFYSQSLSGSVIVKLSPPTAAALPTECVNNGNNTFNCTGRATSTTPVVYFKEKLIFPGDPVPAQLACFERCPDAAALATANPFRTDILSYQTVTPTLATYASYSFSSTTMLLTDSSTGDPVTAATTTAPYQNGITSGLLTEPTNTNLNLLTCPWNPGATCAGMAWTVLPEFYVWETGPNTWNQFVTVRDVSGTPVKFDPPLQVQYIHNQPITTAPDNKYDGVTFFLEYSGFGDLHGIPGKCVDVDNGLDEDCSLSGTNPAIRWVPEFSIPARLANNELMEVSDAGNPSVKYFIKPLEMEERMTTVPLSTCTTGPNALTTSSYILPSMSSWIDPIIGQEPALTTPPAVVGGVVQ